MCKKYPKQILPSTTYQKKLNTEILLKKYPNLIIVRQVKGFREEYLEVTENGKSVLTDGIFYNSMYNLSMNLLGGRFITDRHIMFLPKSEEACRSWEGDCIIPENYQNSDNYTITEPCFGVFFLVNHIHNITFPFRKNFDNEEARDKYATEAENVIREENIKIEELIVGKFVSNREPVEVLARTKVNHSPTQLNYWHVTVDTYRPTEHDYIHPEEKISSGDRKILKALKLDLKEKAVVTMNVDYRIKRCDYKCQLTCWDRLCDMLAIS